MRIIWLIFSLALVACSSQSNSAGIETDKALPNQSLPVIDISYSKHFVIDTVNSNYRLQIFNPDNKELENEFTIKPGENLKIISLSATTNGMLSILNKQKHLVGISNHLELHDDQLSNLYESGQIEEFGDESAYSIELIAKSHADIIIHSGFGKKFPGEEKLNKLGIQVIPLYDWREQHPLGKAEWIKMIGVLTNSVKEANEFFQSTVSKYNDLVYRKHDDQQTKVLSGNLVGDTWYAPTGESFMGQLIKDAGGEYMYQKSVGSGSLALPMEQILKDNRNTDVWINPGFKTKEKILNTNPHSKHLACFDRIYCYSPNMNKFWERSAAEPHLVLEDLIYIFHNNLSEDHVLNFYQKIE